MSERVLPEGWVETTLGAVIELKYGKSLPKKKRDGVGEPVYGSNGIVGFHSEPLVDNPGLVIGRKGSNGKIHYSSSSFFPIDTTYFVDNVPTGNFRYWYYQLCLLPLEELNRSTAIPGLNREDAYAQIIGLPSSSEQKVIAEKLDGLLSQVNNLKARLNSVPAILKRFRQSVLTAAVSGRLTEEWREARKDTGNAWVKLTVGDVANIATGKTPSRKNLRYWEGGDIPWLTSSSTSDWFVDTAEKFVTREAVEECALNFFEPGALLLAMYGEGKTRGQVTELRMRATCNQACAAVTANEEVVLHKFLKLRLLENYEEIRSVASGGAQPNLNLKKVRAIGINVPLRVEQAEIVRCVDQLFAFADQIERQIENAQARVDKLTQSILAKAFRGELTAEWRAANPESISGENSAEALLERIKAEKEKLKPAGRQRIAESKVGIV